VTDRELFDRVMHYRAVDRVPCWHWKCWKETEAAWEKEGVPRDRQAEALSVTPVPWKAPIEVGLFPPFPVTVVEETNEWRIYWDEEGVLVRENKFRSSIPQYLDWSLKDRRSWEPYLARLDPHAPGRFPPEWDEYRKAAPGSGRTLAVPCGSLVGWIRNWMGVRGFSYILFDDRDFFAHMVDTIAECVCRTIERALSEVEFDCAWLWEDICFRSGPLIPPDLFAGIVLPRYRRITDLLREAGVDIVVVDCDGKIDALAGLWLEAGVNCLFPLEIGAWNADPAAFRRKYGRRVRIIGGIDKRALMKGKEEIDKELALRVPLMRDGGYVPLVDHVISPDIPLENYRYFLGRLKALRFAGSSG